jgi:hypothetical protein
MVQDALHFFKEDCFLGLEANHSHGIHDKPSTRVRPIKQCFIDEKPT